jgi:tetratricopeptide (TPR) repeat protein
MTRTCGKHFVMAVAALAVLLGTKSQSQTQRESAILQGHVRDSVQHAVPDASVFLQVGSLDMLVEKTDLDGAYRFSAVPPKLYVLHAEKDGVGVVISAPFALGPKESRTMDLTLTPPKAVAASSSPAQPELFDEPHFKVAGVTDTTNMGGHGTEPIVRNREALAKATAALGKADPGTTAVVMAGELEHERAQIRARLATDHDPQQRNAELHHQLGDIDEKLGDALEAEREYEKAAALDPSESYLFDWGAELLMHRAAEPAIEVFAKGNRLYPQSMRMLSGLGAAWYSHGFYERATQFLCEASDLRPQDPNPYLFLGKMQSVESVGWPAAVERLARFARFEPENALANYYYAVALWKRRESPQGLQDLGPVESLLEKAVRLNPQLAEAHLQLGLVYAEQQDFRKAISAYQRAIEASPQLEQAHYRLALAYQRMGEAGRARAEMQRFEQISVEKTEEVERQRREMQQFIYQMRNSAPPPQPQ